MLCILTYSVVATCVLFVNKFLAMATVRRANRRRFLTLATLSNLEYSPVQVVLQWLSQILAVEDATGVIALMEEACRGAVGFAVRQGVLCWPSRLWIVDRESWIADRGSGIRDRGS